MVNGSRFWPIEPPLFNITEYYSTLLEVVAIRQEKEMKDIKTGKEEIELSARR